MLEIVGIIVAIIQGLAIAMLGIGFLIHVINQNKGR